MTSTTEPTLQEAALPADRKSAILAAALAVFSEQGIEAATIDAIRQRCGASVGSIYHHFGAKEGIAAALFAQGLDDYWGGLAVAIQDTPDARQAIRALITCHLNWIVARPDLARFLFSRRQAVSSAYDAAIRERTAGHFKVLLTALQPWFRTGVLRRLPVELYGPMLLGPAQELARAWLAGRLTLDLRDAIDELAGAAWRSLAADSALQHDGPRAPYPDIK